MNRKYLLLSTLVFLIILAFAAFVYFYKLGQIPNGVYVDEAAVIYNAKSILETGKDEYGQTLPIYFRLMGSYTPPLFIYVSAFLMKFFGPGLLVARSISGVSMLISVVFFFLLARKVGIYKNKTSYLLVTFFYAITPWIVFNARLGYETTLGFLIFNIGVYYLYSALENPKYYSWSVLFLSISTYISHNQRFLAPLILLTFVIFFRKLIFIRQNKFHLIYALIIGVLTQIPNIVMLGTNAFWVKNVQFNFKYFWNFYNYLSPKTIFWESGDIDLQHTIPGLSLAYNWMVFPYIFGLFFLVKNIQKNGNKFITLYGLTTLVPAVFSGYFLSTQRSLAFAVPLLFIIGIGIDYLLTKVGKKTLFWVVCCFVIFYSLLILYRSYFVLFPKERANAWNYGYDQLAVFIQANPGKKFVIDDTRNPQSYILFLYYLDYPPLKYQGEVESKFKNNYYQSLPAENSYQFSNIKIHPVDWKRDLDSNYIIGDPLSISDKQAKEHGLSKVGEVRDPLGEVVFNIYSR